MDKKVCEDLLFVAGSNVEKKGAEVPVVNASRVLVLRAIRRYQDLINNK
jgi:hypothetical protein